MRRFISLCTSALLLAAVSLAAAQSSLPSTTAPATASSQPYAALRTLLASADFSRRQFGQKQLDEISPAEMEALAAWAAQETDPEVKARLDARVDDMAGWRLTHPPPLTVDFQDASLPDIVAELNRQLGGTLVIAGRGGVGLGADTFTLAAKQQPLMAIIQELNRQSPLAITPTISLTGAGSTASLGLNRAAVTRDYKIVDTFALSAQILGQPAAATWRIAVSGFADPRVRIVQFAQLRIDKLTDQDGKSLMPAVVPDAGNMNSSIRPVVGWTSAAQLTASPGLQRIKQLHASILLRVLEQEQTVTLDLSKDIAPLQISRGTLSVERQPGADPILHLDPPASNVAPAIASGSPQQFLTIRTFDSAGKPMGTSLTAGARVTIILRGVGATGRVELSWPDKTRNVTLPVEWSDLLPPVALPPAGVVPKL